MLSIKEKSKTAISYPAKDKGCKEVIKSGDISGEIRQESWDLFLLLYNRCYAGQPESSCPLQDSAGPHVHQIFLHTILHPFLILLANGKI